MWAGEGDVRAGGINAEKGVEMRSAREVKDSEMEGIRKEKKHFSPLLTTWQIWLFWNSTHGSQANICKTNKDVAPCRWVIALGHTKHQQSSSSCTSSTFTSMTNSCNPQIH